MIKSVKIRIEIHIKFVLHEILRHGLIGIGIRRDVLEVLATLNWRIRVIWRADYLFIVD